MGPDLLIISPPMVTLIVSPSSTNRNASLSHPGLLPGPTVLTIVAIIVNKGTVAVSPGTTAIGTSSVSAGASAYHVGLKRTDTTTLFAANGVTAVTTGPNSVFLARINP